MTDSSPPDFKLVGGLAVLMINLRNRGWTVCDLVTASGLSPTEVLRLRFVAAKLAANNIE